MSFRFLTLCAVSFGISGAALAQETAPSISLELNSATTSAESTCQVVFLGQNALGRDLTAVTWRLAVLDSDGVFKNLLSLPLGALSDGKRRIVQYNLPSPCAELSEIILNDLAECEIDGAASDLCLTQLSVSSRTDIKFGL